VTITLLTKPEALAFDRTRHLYAAWNGGTSSLIGTVSKCEELRAVCVNQGMSEGEAGGLALDPAGNIVLGDQTAHVINIYAPGAATPTRSFSTGTVQPYKFELNRGGTILYVADISGTPEIVEYNYATGAEIGTITNSLSSPGLRTLARRGHRGDEIVPRWPAPIQPVRAIARHATCYATFNTLASLGETRLHMMPSPDVATTTP
jgi:hypothetical protein